MNANLHNHKDGRGVQFGRTECWHITALQVNAIRKSRRATGWSLLLFSIALQFGSSSLRAAEIAPTNLDDDTLGGGFLIQDNPNLSTIGGQGEYCSAPLDDPHAGTVLASPARAASCGGCAAGVGMPVWSVSEPAVNLWLSDIPLVYPASRGRSMRFHLYYKNRLGTQGTMDNSAYEVFSVGARWHTPWRSYVQPVVGESTNYWVMLGNGAVLKLTTNRVDYHTQGWLTEVSSTTNIIEFPDGSQRVFGKKTTAGGVTRYFLTSLNDPQGNAITFQYTEAGGTVRLDTVTDVDNRTITFAYSSNVGGYSNVITKISSPHGTNAVLIYDGSANLTNITDSVNLTNRLVYTGANLTSMVTPYGTTAFAHYSNSTNMYAVRVNELSVRRHLYLYRAEIGDGKVPVNYTAYVPSTTNGTFTLAHSFDHVNSHQRNSFLWNPRQYDQLSESVRTDLDGGSFDADDLTSGDYLKGRQRHWLLTTNGTQVSIALSMSRDASPDGSLQGQTHWLDYADKFGSNPDREGAMRRPRVIALKQPNAESRFSYADRNALGHVTNRIETFSADSGAVQVRTNQYVYAANNIDLIKHVQFVGGASKLVSSNAFNSSHRLLTNFNAIGEATVYTYNGKGQLLTAKAPGGLTRSNVYTSSGTWSNFLTQSIQVEVGASNSYSWSNGFVFAKTDPRGLATTIVRDSLGRKLKTLFPDGTGVTNNYQKLHLESVFDRLGNSNRYVYNGFRKPIEISNPLNKTTTNTYCDCGTLNSVTDPLGKSTSFAYDLQGKRTATIYANGGSVTNHYNLINQVTNVVDSAGKSMTNCYNNQGLLCVISNSFGFMKMTKFDEEDQPMMSVDANTVTNSFTFDDLGRTISRTDGDGNIEGFLYSNLGVIAHTNPLGHVTWYAYDSAGRRTAETNANGEVIQYFYNAAGDLTKLIDGKGQETTWGYNAYGRVTSKTNAANQEIFRYAYDANGRLTNRWSLAKGNTRYVYDSAGNLTLVDYPSSQDITMQYDANNRLTNMVDAAGTTRYAYTDWGALSSEDGPWDSDTVTYGYTTNRMRARMTLLQPNASDWVQTYAYDNAGRLTNVTSPAGAFGYQYDSMHNLLVRKLTQPPGSAITNSYAVLGRWTGTYLRTSGGALLNSHEYDYDDASRRTRQTRTGGDFVDYSYDNVGQLKTASGKEYGGTTNRMNEQFGYAYDAAWNLQHRTNGTLVQTFGCNNQNEITNVTSSGAFTVVGHTFGAATNVTVADNGNSPVAALRYVDYSFARTNVTLIDGTNTFVAVAKDADSRADTNTTTAYLPATVTLAWDGNGNLITNGTRTFAYDDENQLTAITEPNAWKSEFTYDGLRRRRLCKEFSWNGNTWNLTNEVRYVYDNRLVLQERDTLNLPVISYTRGRDASGTLQRAGGTCGMLALTHSSPIAASHYYYHNDANGNITAFIASNAVIVARYFYDPLGGMTAQLGALAEMNPYRTASKEIHRNSSLLYYLYRYCDPHLQRWLNRDPAGERGGINLYSFVGNAFPNRLDPYGLCDLIGVFDSGWRFEAAIPDPDLTIPANGSASSTSVLLVYRRTKTELYRCCIRSKATYMRFKSVYYTTVSADTGNAIEWLTGPAGPWPPRDLGDFLGELLSGVIYAPVPQDGQQAVLDQLGLENVPDDSEQGELLPNDDGIPN